MQIITQNNINNISIKKQQNLMYKLKPKNPFSQYQTHPTIKPQNKKLDFVFQNRRDININQNPYEKTPE